MTQLQTVSQALRMVEALPLLRHTFQMCTKSPALNVHLQGKLRSALRQSRAVGFFKSFLKNNEIGTVFLS